MACHRADFSCQKVSTILSATLSAGLFKSSHTPSVAGDDYLLTMLFSIRQADILYLPISGPRREACRKFYCSKLYRVKYNTVSSPAGLGVCDNLKCIPLKADSENFAVRNNFTVLDNPPVSTDCTPLAVCRLWFHR